MRFLLILCALIGLMLGWAFGEESPRPAGLPLVQVELKSGRHFTAALDPRSGSQRLWLRFGTPSLRITRPVDWEHVQHIRWQGTGYTPEEFLAKLPGILRELSDRTSSPADAATANFRGGPGKISSGASKPEGSVPLSRWAAVALGQAPRVTHIDVHARVLAGTRAGDQPRLRLVVAPRGRTMQDVPALGTLSVELRGYRRSTRQEVVLYRWTRDITPAEYSPLGASVDLEVPRGLARPWPNLAPRGKLVVRFAVAGQGVFRAEVPGVAIPE